MFRRVAPIALCLLLGCQPCTRRDHNVRAPKDAPVAVGSSVTSRDSSDASAPLRRHLLATEAKGLSGLTSDDHGNLWAVGEDGDVLVRISRRTLATEDRRIVGCPPTLELESVTWTGARRFVFGTETDEDGRKREQLFGGKLRKRGMFFDSIALCEYDQWNVVARGNHGMEGLCFAADRYVCAAELVVDNTGTRTAPVGVFDPQTEEWSPHHLRLSSETGKLSGLACRKSKRGDIIEVIAIERHFGVARLLRFEISLEPDAPMVIVPRYADLTPLFDEVPNLEGIVWEQDGSVLMIEDNQFRGHSDGENLLYEVSGQWLEDAWRSLD